jgi:hypothetical protein
LIIFLVDLIVCFFKHFNGGVTPPDFIDIWPVLHDYIIYKGGRGHRCKVLAKRKIAKARGTDGRGLFRNSSLDQTICTTH